jgi:hypothetical protein
MSQAEALLFSSDSQGRVLLQQSCDAGEESHEPLGSRLCDRLLERSRYMLAVQYCYMLVVHPPYFKRRRCAYSAACPCHAARPRNTSSIIANDHGPHDDCSIFGFWRPLQGALTFLIKSRHATTSLRLRVCCGSREKRTLYLRRLILFSLPFRTARDQRQR